MNKSRIALTVGAILLATMCLQDVMAGYPTGNTNNSVLERRVYKLEQDMAHIKAEARKRGIDL
jgi:hypothetical protein